jgi:ferritin
MPQTETTTTAICEQIQAEFTSAYVYLGMSAWFAENNFPGFAHWMRMQWQEETMHAMKLYDFVHSRGGAMQLLPIAAARTQYTSVMDVFTHVQKHEEYITQRIYNLYELAQSERDLPLQIVLQWFINEQVEEESQVSEIVEQLKRIGNDGPALYLLDRQVALRQAPTATEN